VLEDAHRTGFERIITGDKSWLFLSYPHDSAWGASRDELRERVTQKIDTEKCLISILWSVNAIQSLSDAPKGNTYNIAFFSRQGVRSSIHGITFHGRRKTLERFPIDLDNASPHNSRKSQELLEANRATRVQHRAHGPDPAPSDLFLCGCLGKKLTDYDC
jgi:hypothetical protein